MLKLSVFAVMLPCALAAEAYGTVEGCARHLHSTSTGSLEAALWDRTAGELRFHETVCAVQSVSMPGSGAVLLETLCESEGGAWPAWYYLMSSADENVYSLAPQEDPMETTELTLCK